MAKEQAAENQEEQTKQATDYILEATRITDITYKDIAKHSTPEVLATVGSSYAVFPTFLALNEGVFTFSERIGSSPLVKVVQFPDRVWVSCSCLGPKVSLCAHQAQVLQALTIRPELRVFFDEQMRRDKIIPTARDYGLADAENLDEYFDLEYANKTVSVTPKLKELLPVNAETQAYLSASLLPQNKLLVPTQVSVKETSRLIVVLTEHKYYKHLYLELYQAAITQEGKIKNPLQSISPADLIWLTDNPEEVKFYSAIAKFQRNYHTDPAESDREALKALVKNPLGLSFYLNQPKKNTAGVEASTLMLVQLQNVPLNLELDVDVKDNFYQINGHLTIQEQKLHLLKLLIKHEYFIQIKNNLYLIPGHDIQRVIQFFKKRNHKILIHESKFPEFRETILANLESKIRINYSYVKSATEKQIVDYGFDETQEPLIYLSESEDFILITPVMRYGPLEIPIHSQKQIYATDA
ncbi:MAG: ATP-dependent helicase, partial [Bacteroidota bacterium]|nr:ATP-dependent helicase [Bacteroidota bacterium]